MAAHKDFEEFDLTSIHKPCLGLIGVFSVYYFYNIFMIGQVDPALAWHAAIPSFFTILCASISTQTREQGFIKWVMLYTIFLILSTQMQPSEIFWFIPFGVGVTSVMVLLGKWFQVQISKEDW